MASVNCAFRICLCFSHDTTSVAEVGINSFTRGLRFVLNVISGFLDSRNANIVALLPRRSMDEVQKHHVTTAEDKYGQSVVCFLRNPKPVQITEQMSDTVIFLHVTDEMHCCIENELQPVQHVTRNTRQGRTVIVESCHYQLSLIHI